VQEPGLGSWPYFGRTRTLNAAAYCALVSTVWPGQQRNGQVAGARDTVYGSDDHWPWTGMEKARDCRLQVDCYASREFGVVKLELGDGVAGWDIERH
jgi:hypothetical protein